MKDILLVGTGLVVGIIITLAYTPVQDPIAQAGNLVVLNSVSTADVSSIEDAEVTLFNKDGVYKQVIKGDAIAGLQLPQNAEVNIYEAPGGRGYEIRYEDADNYYSVGFGPEAAQRTWTFSKIVSSSTPAAIIK